MAPFCSCWSSKYHVGARGDWALLLLVLTPPALGPIPRQLADF